MEYKKGTGTILAIDFDGTIVEHDYPRIGAFMPGAIETILDLEKAGYTLILWTCRESHDQLAAWELCRNAGLTFRSVNHNTKEDEWAGSRKIYANHYIDDRNIGGFIGWDKVREILL